MVFCLVEADANAWFGKSLFGFSTLLKTTWDCLEKPLKKIHDSKVMVDIFSAYAILVVIITVGTDSYVRVRLERARLGTFGARPA